MSSKKNLFKSVTMDTETTFHANGDVTTLPNGWEEYKAPVTLDGEKMALRGRMEVQPARTSRPTVMARAASTRRSTRC